MSQDTKEIWKGYAPGYEVSSHGRFRSIPRNVVCKNGVVKNLKGKVISPALCPAGYYHVNVSMGNKSRSVDIHRAVAEVFLEREPGKNYVNHKDLNKRNNAVENLEWVSGLENNIHFQKTFSGKMQNRKLVASHVKCIKDMLSRGVAPYKISALYGVRPNVIYNIKNGKTWGYI